MARILVGLSGGVDSAVAALRLCQAGHEVAAAYMKTWMNEEGIDVFGDCPWQQDITDAQAVATALGIPFRVVNLIREYREKVVEYMLDGYASGRTPNPDVMCNREMKFGVFLEIARKEGFDFVATGHYCQRRDNPDGSADILEGADPNKDQSYFLALVRQEQLRRALFPVGGLLKPEVRALASRYGLPVAQKKDSQGICFLGKIRINDFLEKHIPDRAGQIVNTAGRVVGEHKGLHRFTLGQRKGLGVPSNKDFERYVVVKKDFATNRLIVAFEAPDAPGLYERRFLLRGLSWVNQPVTEARELLSRPRYRDPAQQLHFEPGPEGTATITFAQAQRALAPGQVCALYDGTVLLGGGFYC